MARTGKSQHRPDPRRVVARGRGHVASLAGQGYDGVRWLPDGVDTAIYEAAVGSDKLQQDRRAYLAEQKSSQRGISREKSWNEFRAAKLLGAERLAEAQ